MTTPATDEQLHFAHVLLSFTAGASFMGVAILIFLITCTRGLACY